MDLVVTNCPCGASGGYDDCCGRLHRREADAGTAEQLMRSRYSAYVVGDDAYLRWSWHPTTAPSALTLDPDVGWRRLEIVAVAGGGLLDVDGTVEFRAHHRLGFLAETSGFARHDGRWVYVGPVDPA
ncbi:MAG: YchJ family metal-binding protein [Actinomycetota bacterium]|nr:YchJ family metal-binding protein [Actinomycetota bacterium]